MRKCGWTAARVHGLGPSWGVTAGVVTRLRWKGRARQLSESPTVAPTLSLRFPLIVKEQTASSVKGADGTERFHRNAFQRFMCQTGFFFPFQVDFFFFFNSPKCQLFSFSYGSRGRGGVKMSVNKAQPCGVVGRPWRPPAGRSRCACTPAGPLCLARFIRQDCKIRNDSGTKNNHVCGKRYSFVAL